MIRRPTGPVTLSITRLAALAMAFFLVVFLAGIMYTQRSADEIGQNKSFLYVSTGREGLLYRNITELKGKNEELLKRVKVLESLVQEQDTKGSKGNNEQYESRTKGGNLRSNQEKLQDENMKLDHLLDTLNKAESQGLQLPTPNLVSHVGESKIGKRSISSLLGESTVLLIIASNRPEYLKKTLSYVIKYHPLDSVPIVVSEDGNSPRVAEVIEEMKSQFKGRNPSVPFLHIHNGASNQYFEDGYWKLCAHFKWALNQVFGNKLIKSENNNNENNNNYIDIRRVILLEEDLQIAPDFFEYFASTADLLDTDKRLMAVSAWNDNGQGVRVQDNKALYRSDFFPGLGWMLNRDLWNELSVKWPKGYWDDWLREPAQRKGRHFIRPEICRTYHFGAHGVSNGQFQDGFLNDIKLADEFVPFTQLDLSYLKFENWDTKFLSAVDTATSVNFGSFSSHVNSGRELKIMYSGFDGGQNSYVNVAHWAGVMDNIKANVPRTAYNGIVTTWKQGTKLHLVPVRRG